MPYIQSYQPDKKRGKKPLIIAGVIAVLILLIIAGWIIFMKDKAAAPTTEAKQENATINKDYSSIDAKYLFTGTVVPARAVENEARRSDGTVDYNQPFSKFSTFNPGQYDGWTTDLECPVTDATISYQQQVANTIFNCRPEFLKPMSKYFTMLNLANNHVYDLGKEKFPQMQKYVQDAGFQYLGNQDPSATKDVCEVMAMKVNIKKKDGSTVPGSLPIAFCAWHYFEREPYAGEFDVMKQYADIMPVVGLMQVGVEYVPKADARQESVSRSIIDNGAEFVIGNSPHWVQNTDAYKGKLIVYSTGNFVFDQLDAETNRGMGIEVNMSVPYDDNVAKWLALSEECKAHYDSCLQKAQAQKLTKIKPKFTYGITASTTGYRQLTQKAPESVLEAIKARANWDQTMKAVGQE